MPCTAGVVKSIQARARGEVTLPRRFKRPSSTCARKSVHGCSSDLYIQVQFGNTCRRNSNMIFQIYFESEYFSARGMPGLCSVISATIKKKKKKGGILHYFTVSSNRNFAGKCA